MPCCGSTLIVSSKQSSTAGCATASCNNLGPADCIQTGLSPRRNRGKIIEQIKDYVMLMLGAPVVEIELDDQQLDLAVKQTLKVMEYFAPREYFRYYNFITSPGQSVYKMPPDVGYIRNVYYRQTAEFAFQSADLQGALPIEYFYPGGAYSSIQGGLIDPIQPIWGRAGEWSLYKGYERLYSRMSSGIGGWEFVGGYGYVKIYPVPFQAYHVIVHYMQRCNDWDEVTLAMQEGALCHAMLMLSTIRKKYVSPPGPGGGIQLDGEAMRAEAVQMYSDWKNDLLYKWGDVLGITTG